MVVLVVFLGGGDARTTRWGTNKVGAAKAAR